MVAIIVLLGVNTQKNTSMKKFISLSIIIIVSMLCIGTRGSAQWKQTNGPNGGFVTSFAVIEPNLFVGTRYGGVFYSSNNGANWIAANSGLSDRNVFSLVASGDNLYAGTSTGVFISKNRGNTWDSISINLPIELLFCTCYKRRRSFCWLFRWGCISHYR